MKPVTGDAPAGVAAAASASAAAAAWGWRKRAITPASIGVILLASRVATDRRSRSGRSGAPFFAVREEGRERRPRPTTFRGRSDPGALDKPMVDQIKME